MLGRQGWLAGAVLFGTGAPCPDIWRQEAAKHCPGDGI